MKTDTLELAAQIFTSGRISPSEQHLLSAVLDQEPLEDGERALIQRIFYGIRHGMLQVID